MRSSAIITTTPNEPCAELHNRMTVILGPETNSLRIMRRRFYDPGSGCCMVLVRRGRCRIEFAIVLLDPPRADMALYHDANMVWAIAGTCRVKFLSRFAGGEGENALA